MHKTTLVKDLKAEITLLHKIIETISTSASLDILLQHIARIIAEAMKTDSCLVYLCDEPSKSLILSGACPPHPNQIGKIKLESGEGLTGWVASHKKPIAIAKNAYKDSRFKVFLNLPEDKYEMFLSVPILLKNDVIGVLNLQSRKSKTITKEQVKLLVSIACELSGAIEKTRFSQIAHQKSQQLQTIAQLSSSIVSNAYIHEILQLIVTMTAQLMGSKICSLMLLNEKTQELSIESTQSLSSQYRKKPPIKVGQSISGLAIKSKKPVTVLDVTREPGYGYPAIAKSEGLRSMLAVPMLIKEKPIGVLNCYTVTEHCFTEEEVNIIQTIANQSAVAIENTRLLKESKIAHDALETRKFVDRAKGILMKEKKLTEPEAFQFIQRQAMNLRRTMKEIAEAIILNQQII
ncbi:MAG: GAF domain-containing protein [Endomicrobiales bacterium]|jgi:signal transduction protein with GAF and PtsI domain